MKRYIGQSLEQRDFCTHGVWVPAHGRLLLSQSESSITLSFRIFVEASLHWLLVIDSTSSPSLLLGNYQVGMKVPSLYSRFVPLATIPHP